MENQKKVEIVEDEFIIVKSRKPTEKDLFYLSWGLELVKNQFNLVNELLKQQISLCLTLLGVSLIFEKVFENDNQYKFVVALCFFIGLIFAFIGLMPFDRKSVWLDSPDDIENFQKDALNFKKIMYTISGILIILGVGLIIIKLAQLAF